MSDSPVILISGCSSGLGRHLVQSAVEAGFRVVATARRPESIQDMASDRVTTMRLDVTTSEAELVSRVKEAVSAFQRIDVLINNAGYLLGGAIEETSYSETSAQYETLVFGPMKLANAVLPHMRERKLGVIVNVSSQGSVLNLAGAGVYCSCKAAIDSLTDALDKEITPFGLRACSLQVGSFATEVASSGNLKRTQKTIEGYDNAHDWVQGFNAQAGKEAGDPGKLSRRLVKLLREHLEGVTSIPRRQPLGDDATEIVPSRLHEFAQDMEKNKALGQGLTRGDA